MKKNLMILVLLTAVLVAATAQTIDLSKVSDATTKIAESTSKIDFSALPVGKWLDSNWDAIWEFGATGIKLYKTNGDLVYSFESAKLKDYKFTPKAEGGEITFYCAETTRDYKFAMKVGSKDMTMTINPDWTTKDYTVVMKMQ